MTTGSSADWAPGGYPRKYWWVVLIALPIVLALTPLLRSCGPENDVIYVSPIGTQLNGPVAFHTVNVVEAEATQRSRDLPENVEELLNEAMRLVEDQKFEEAIPLFRSAADVAPLPAVYANLSAAYLASNQPEKAKQYFGKAGLMSASGEAVRTNLERLTESGSVRLLSPPQGGGYRGVRLQYWPNRRLVLELNGKTLGVFDAYGVQNLDHALTPNATNVLTWQFSEPEADLYIEALPPNSDRWTRVYDFDSTKDDLFGVARIVVGEPAGGA